MDFAFKHLNVGGKIIGLQRDDKLEILEEAMREGLINAFCHKSYDNLMSLVFKRPSTNGNDTQNSADDTQNDTQNVSNDTQKQKNCQRFIEECIADDNTVSTSVMAWLLGISVITVKKELKALGYKWVGHAKSGFWIKED